MNIAYVGTKNGSHRTATQFLDVEALLSVTDSFDALVLTRVLSSEVVKLRQEPRYRFCLIYTESQVSDDLLCLTDGIVPSERHLSSEIRNWQQRLALFHLNSSQCSIDTFELLKYLWLRPKFFLSPVKQVGLSFPYRYPLLGIFGINECEQSARLLQLCREGFLETSELINKIRLCPSCGDSRLNFVETCPQCGGIDHKQEVALHCFACGHIAEQHNFVVHNGLSCPNCMSVLRHIGVDYDRPIENVRCNSCDAFFIDGEVKAACLSCDVQISPNQLEARSVYQYQIGDRGMQLIKGDEGSSLQLELGQYMDYEPFCWAVNWCLNLGLRHSVSFAVVVLSIANLEQLVSVVGEDDAGVLVFKTGEKIRSLLRASDLTCQNDSGNILLLFPNTDKTGLSVILNKLRALDNMDDVQLALHSAVFPEMQQSSEDGHMLIARLLSEFVVPEDA